MPHIVPRDHIFGARTLVDASTDFSLVTCEVRPGFEYEDFVLVDSKDILQRYPALVDVVKCYTRNHVVSTESQAPFLTQNLDLDSNKNENINYTDVSI